MSRLKKEITETKTAINSNTVKKNHPQRLAEDVLEQISGGWVNAFLRWEKSW